MQAIVNGKIVLPDRLVEGSALLFAQKIEGVVALSEVPADAERIDAAGGYVIPGLIDMHIHGYLGEDASDGSFDGLRTMAEGVAKNGVTGFLPTTMTVSYDELRAAFAQIRRAAEASEGPDWQGAQVLGVVSIFTYGMEKGLKRLEQAQLKNVSLSNFDVLVKVAVEEGYIPQSDAARLIAFRDNPQDESWMN